MAAIGFIGLGNMGAPMAANLVKSGDSVVGFDVVAAARQESAQSGIEIAPTATARVEKADVIVTMLPAGEHVRSVWGRGLALGKTRRTTYRLLDDRCDQCAGAHALAAERGIAGLMRRSRAGSPAPRPRL